MNVQSDILERNLGRLITSAATADVQQAAPPLLEAVRAEVRAERRRRARQRLYCIGAVGGLAAAAALVIVCVILRTPPTSLPAAPLAVLGQAKTLYGLATLADGKDQRPLTGSSELHAGQWVQTLTGSLAEVLLADASKVLLQPRTLLQVLAKPNGQKLLLQEGQVTIQAARQAPGHCLTIATPGSEITVLGTTLDVHLIQRPDGIRQTRVSVNSGKVQMSGAGRSIQLLANMEGIVNEGQAPTARSLTSAINELMRLRGETAGLTDGSGQAAGPPAIFEFSGDGSATVWTLLKARNSARSPSERVAVAPAVGCAGLEAYLPEGLPLPVKPGPSVGQWEIDLAAAPLPPGEAGQIVLKLSQATGIFQAKGAGAFEVDLPPSDVGLSLLQFRLPPFAVVQEAAPEPFEKRYMPSRLILLLRGSPPRLFVEPSEN